MISVSETWNPSIEKSGNKPKTLEENHNYHGVKRNSLKSGVDFMSKEGINFSLEKILKYLILMKMMNFNVVGLNT